MVLDCFQTRYIKSWQGCREKERLEREKLEDKPKYAEMCRRYIADCKDSSIDKINMYLYISF